MSGPLSAALRTLEDANSSHASVARAAQERWKDAAQRAYWGRIVQEIDREQRQYQVAVNQLDRNLSQALRLLGS